MIDIKKRRRQGVTNYRKRVKLLKSGLPRLVVRKSNTGIIMQIVEYSKTADKIVVGVDSTKLSEIGWNPKANAPTAYLTGMYIAKQAKAKAGSIAGQDIILDIGLYRPTKNSVVFAAARGASDGGLKIRGTINVDNDRINGSAIAKYAEKMFGEDKDKFNVHFSSYLSKKIDVKQLDKVFEQVKKKLND